VREEVKQVAQFVEHPVAVEGRAHVVVPVYGAAQALQVIAPVAEAAMVHAEQPVEKPPELVDETGLVTPVWQL
jgi:hypothetical protein